MSDECPLSYLKSVVMYWCNNYNFSHVSSVKPDPGCSGIGFVSLTQFCADEQESKGTRKWCLKDEIIFGRSLDPAISLTP